MQQRRKDLPSDVQLVVSHKVGVVSLERIEDERLVRLGDFSLCESLLVGEVKFDGDGTCSESGRFGVHLHVDCFGGLDPEHKLVSGNIVEDALDGVLELDSDFDFTLVECWSLVLNGVSD